MKHEVWAARKCKRCGKKFMCYPSQNKPHCPDCTEQYWAKNEDERRQKLTARSIKWQRGNKIKVYVERIARENGDLLNVLFECCCITEKKEFHHPDYKRPFEVLRLCPACHGKWHALLRTKNIGE